MEKAKLRLIKGGPDISLGDAPKKFISAFVTNTRLMGVLVVYVHWKVETGEDHLSLHQFFYVETTEVGIESYRSVYGNNQKTLIEIEQAMTGGLGGEKVGISEKETYMLLQKYADLTEKLGNSLPSGIEEYGFVLDENPEYTSMEEIALFKKTCAKITNTEQLINYFLMRYISADFTASDYLSYQPLDRDIVPTSKSQILCINEIETRRDENGNVSYICESLVEDMTIYRILITELRLKGKLISSFDKISDFTVSPAEAAMKLARPEFITVFEIMDGKDEVIEAVADMYPAALINKTDMGIVYMMFKNNNDHLKEAFYRLNDDIKGIIYVTDEDQLIVSSYSLPQINRLENEIQYSKFGNMVIALAKYEFKESIFYDFMQSDTGDFLHYMEYVSDYDPDND